ncbi:hypothetical protein BDF20DRAFT_891457 [Mycotypha africana]|uniref:uncharacterized protein n=1 Tax=Mycotypha africana TaxID=64632 RepID=UPI002301F15C|nr:uncharacterized protein BDF20DRAFT_891457 [Mycotypha africana]KAI8970463.1 hypothetical protein BDF20DRAFT_891457 [Mycotypha africana]
MENKNLIINSTSFGDKKMPLKPTVIPYDMDSSDEEDDINVNSATTKNVFNNKTNSVQSISTTTAITTAKVAILNNSNISSTNNKRESTVLASEARRLDETNTILRRRAVCWFTDIAGKDSRSSHDRLMDFFKKDNDKYLLIYLEKHPHIRMGKKDIYKMVLGYFHQNGIKYRTLAAITSHSAQYLIRRYQAALRMYITNPSDTLGSNTIQVLQKKYGSSEEAWSRFKKLVANECPDFWYLFKVTGDIKRDLKFSRAIMATTRSQQKQTMTTAKKKDPKTIAHKDNNAAVATKHVDINTKSSPHSIAKQPMYGVSRLQACNTTKKNDHYKAIRAAAEKSYSKHSRPVVQIPLKRGLQTIRPIAIPSMRALATTTTRITAPILNSRNENKSMDNTNKSSGINFKLDSSISDDDHGTSNTNQKTVNTNVKNSFINSSSGAVKADQGTINNSSNNCASNGNKQTISTGQEAITDNVERHNSHVNNATNNPEQTISKNIITERPNATLSTIQKRSDNGKDDRLPQRAVSSHNISTSEVINPAVQEKQCIVINDEGSLEKKIKELDILERELMLQERQLCLRERELQLQREAILKPQEYERERNLKIRKMEVDADEYEREKRAKIRRLELENLELERKLIGRITFN